MSFALSRTRRAVATIAMAIVAMTGTTVMTASPAHAQGYWAQKCGPGFSLYWKASLRPGDYAHIRVFRRHSGSNTDWCALTVRHGLAKGNRSWTAVKLARGQSYDWRQIDRGHFKYYAGPVRIWNSRHASFEGRITYNGVKGRIVGVATP